MVKLKFLQHAISEILFFKLQSEEEKLVEFLDAY